VAIRIASRTFDERKLWSLITTASRTCQLRSDSMGFIQSLGKMKELDFEVLVTPEKLA
jgi:hypothetical protein